MSCSQLALIREIRVKNSAPCASVAKFCVCLARWPTVQPGGCHGPRVLPAKIRNPHSSQFFVSKAFKAIQGFLETFFYFYVPPLRQRFTPLPNGASTFSGAWRLAPGAFAMGVFARFCANRCQAMPGYANLCQPPPSPYFLAHSHLSIPLILSILSKNLCFICAHLWLKNQTVF